MEQLEPDRFAVEWEVAEGVAEKLAVEESLEEVAEESEQSELTRQYEAEPGEPAVVALVFAAAFAAQLSTFAAQSIVVASAVQSTAFEIRADKVEVVDHLLYPEHNKLRYTQVSKNPSLKMAIEAHCINYIENAE